MKDEQGGLVEYLILLAAMAVCSVLIFPSLRSNLVEWNNNMVCNVTKSIGGGGQCADKTENGGDDGFNTTDPNKPPVTGDNKPPTTVDPPKEETKPPEPIKPPEETKPPVKESKYVVKYDRTIPFRYSNVVTHEVKIELNPSNFDYSLSKKEGKDIKFIKPGGQVLNSFIEKWDPNGESTVWVKSVGTDTNQLEMVIDDTYTSANDPNKVFILYETFDKPLDPNLWYVPPEYKDRVEVEDGVLYLDRATIGIKKALWMRYATIQVDFINNQGGEPAEALMISNKLLKDASKPGLELLSIHPGDTVEYDEYPYLEMIDHTGSKDSQKGTKYYSHGYQFSIYDFAKYDIFIDTDWSEEDHHWYDYARAKERGQTEYIGNDVMNELPNRNYIWLGYWREDPNELEYLIDSVATFDSIIIHQGEEPIIGTVEKQ